MVHSTDIRLLLGHLQAMQIRVLHVLQHDSVLLNVRINNTSTYPHRSLSGDFFCDFFLFLLQSISKWILYKSIYPTMSLKNPTFQEAGFSWEEISHIHQAVSQADAGNLIPESTVWSQLKKRNHAVYA
jgi:hypothetical protein